MALAQSVIFRKGPYLVRIVAYEIHAGCAAGADRSGARRGSETINTRSRRTRPADEGEESDEEPQGFSERRSHGRGAAGLVRHGGQAGVGGRSAGHARGRTASPKWWLRAMLRCMAQARSPTRSACWICLTEPWPPIPGATNRSRLGSSIVPQMYRRQGDRPQSERPWRQRNLDPRGTDPRPSPNVCSKPECKPGNILVWDRDARGLEACGMTVNTDPGRVRCYGSDVARIRG